MKNKLVISRYQNKITAILFSDNRPVEIRTEDDSSFLHVGDIYTGRIHDLPSGLKGAFVDIGQEICYYPLDELDSAVFSKKIGKARIVCGDEIIFQVHREAIKTKACGLTTKIKLKGKHLVYDPSSLRNGISSKINEPDRSRLKYLSDKFPDDGYVIRTSACQASDEEITEEAFYLKGKYDNIVALGSQAKCGTCLYSTDPFYCEMINCSIQYRPEVIITDIPQVKDLVSRYISEISLTDVSGNNICCELYSDRKIELKSLYNFDKIITGCFHERVWLPNGGYLVIQPTEALTVIDVNTGKASSGNNPDLFRKTNTQAAVQIARELRLRNISGIILVDFINMNEPAMRNEITELLKSELKQDPVPTKYIDITSLQIVELVREKIRRPICECF